MVLVSIVVLILMSGCGSEMLTGVGIGLGTGAGLGEAQRLAQESKAELVERILDLQNDLAVTTDPAQVAAMQKELGSLKKQEEIVSLTEQVSGKVIEGLGKNWQTTDPAEQKDNYAWLLEGVLGIWLGGSYVIEKRRSNEKNKKIEALLANGNKGPPTTIS